VKPAANRKPGIEIWVLTALISGLLVSAFFVQQRIAAMNADLKTADWLTPQKQNEAQPVALPEIPKQPSTENTALFLGLLASELRVVAIGSAYPIPYEAEICPFSKIPQPAMNQLDRDGDGITDDWEIKFGLDRYNTADAQADFDGDGFTNLEEFKSGTDPVDAVSHPFYAEKLRFVKKIDLTFPLIFKGASQMPDGKMVFQINYILNNSTHFLTVGESLEGVSVKRFAPGEFQRDDRLFVVRGNHEIELQKDRETTDPESQAELINVLDRSSKIVTMGALLSLHNDEYTVLGVKQDRVILKHNGTGKVFDIVGLTEEER